MWRWYNLALKIAEDSNHAYKMGAVIIRGGSVLALACNQAEWGKHAEVRAIAKGNDLRDATIIIARRGKRMSKPCLDCMIKIKQVGITKIVYVDWSGNMVIEKPHAHSYQNRSRDSRSLC